MANAAMETLRAMRQHTANCRQCKLDQILCVTYRAYQVNFEREYRKWEVEFVGTGA